MAPLMESRRSPRCFRIDMISTLLLNRVGLRETIYWDPILSVRLLSRLGFPVTIESTWYRGSIFLPSIVFPSQLSRYDLIGTLHGLRVVSASLSNHYGFRVSSTDVVVVVHLLESPRYN